MMLKLSKSKLRPALWAAPCGVIEQIDSAPPYADNPRAVLIHRPRQIDVHGVYSHDKSDHRLTHSVVQYHCGGAAYSDAHNKIKLVHTVEEERVVCCRCEELAIKRGLPSTDEIHGRHVCIGGVEAVSRCCELL